MALGEKMLTEFDHEMATTRKALERVPDNKPDWRPHAKSMTLGALALHLARLPELALKALKSEDLDLDNPGNFRQPVQADTSARPRGAVREEYLQLARRACRGER